MPIVGDLKGVLAGIVSTLEKEGARPGTHMVEQISAWRTRYPFYHPGVGDDPDEIVPEVVLKKLSESLDPQNSVVVTEVGQHQMWAAQSVDREAPRSFLSSGGLGTMASASRPPSARPSAVRRSRWCAWRATGRSR